MAAFVVNASRGDGHTLVVPLDPAVEPRSIDALLVQADAPSVVTALGSSERVEWADRGGMLPCADGCTRRCDEALHGYARVEIDPTSFELHGADCDACEPAAIPESEEEDEDYGEEDEGECHGASGEVTSIVGGRAFVPLNDHDECDGWNIYMLDLTTFPVASDAWDAPTWPSARTTCTADEAPEWPIVELPSFREDPCVREAGARFPRDDCGFCSDEPTHVVASLWNDALHFTGGSTRGGANGGGPLWRADVPLGPGTCPSASDPCGDPAPYASIMGGPDARHWIATDGSAALVVERSAGGPHLRLHRRGESTPARDVTIPFGPTDVIGVRFHADARPLARVIEHGLAALRAPQSCGGAAPVVAPSGASTASCEPGTRRAGGACEAIPLDASDVGFEDARRGSGWGDRCVTHLRAGALDAAEAACARGLAVAERASTRGALLYNLGRIAEARGDVAAARTAYERSLTERPGNAPTVSALAALPR